MVMNETQALGVLKHPNIIRFYSSWIEAGSLFMKLEYCIGGSLLEYLTRAPPTLMSNATIDGRFNCGDVVHRSDVTNSRCLLKSNLTALLQDISSALDYIHSEWRITHGCVGLSTILIQLKSTASREAHRSDNALEEARRQCHEVTIVYICICFFLILSASDWT